MLDLRNTIRTKPRYWLDLAFRFQVGAFFPRIADPPSLDDDTVLVLFRCHFQNPIRDMLLYPRRQIRVETNLGYIRETKTSY